MARFLLILPAPATDDAMFAAWVTAHRARIPFDGTDRLADRAFLRVERHGDNIGAAPTGHLIGTAHPRARPTDGASMPAAPLAADRIAAIFAAYEGGYVAWAEGTDGVAIFRDPSGAQPCYRHDAGLVILYASDSAIITATARGTFTIDPYRVAEALAFRSYRGPATAIGGITELLPGQVEHAWNGARRALWSPGIFAAAARIVADPRKAQALLFDALTAMAAGLARAGGPLLLELSGGLDSSIMAALLRMVDVPFSAVTYVAHGADGDERGPAAAVARHCGIEHHVRELDARHIVLARSTAAHLPRPSARAFTQELDRAGLEVARLTGAAAFVTGGGGDSLFAYLLTASPFLDRLEREGWGRPAWRTLGEIAAVHDATIAEVARRALRRLFLPRGVQWKRDPSLLAPAIVTALPTRIEAMEAGPRTLARGKGEHIRDILAVHDHREPYARSRILPLLFPLMDQGVQEACLRIPTWLWCAGGVNRAVARAALAGHLPETILRRRTKGGFDKLNDDLFDLHAPRIREMLLDGELARAGIIDRDAVAAAWAACLGSERRGHLPRLMRLVDVESWMASVGSGS